MFFIFDLDYTLFDPIELKKDLAQAFRMPVERFDDDYERLFASQGINYSIQKHLKKLKEAGRIDRHLQQDILSKLENIFNDTSKYLYPGVVKILGNVKRKEDYFVLVSFGDPYFQRQKIEKLRRIKHFFDKIIITDKQKEKAMGSLQDIINKNTPLVIVNDKEDETLRIQQKLGVGDIFLVEGPYAKGSLKYKTRELKDLVDYVHRKRGEEKS